MWYRLNKIGRSNENEFRADVQVPADSPWFDGHFPGEPVLPGLAQISMVFDMIQKASGGAWCVSGVSRIRFKRIVRPEERLEIIAVPLAKQTDAFSFRIQVEGELACSGVIRLKRKKKTG